MDFIDPEYLTKGVIGDVKNSDVVIVNEPVFSF